MKLLRTDQVEAMNVDEAGTMRVRWMLAKNVDAPNFYMRMIEVQPDSATEYHTHPWEHEVYMVAGKCEVQDADGNRTELTPGMFAYVAPNEKHQLINIGDSLMQFICVIPKPE